ncbi:MAG: hypothetical protein GY943_00310 [Chloroflexi bacterium]|nr:hypothetical protein [Chloroflexota bacterium]
MKVDKLKQRLKKDRKNIMVSIRMPEDVIEDLKRIAPLLGFSGYQPLMRAYVGQGLRDDLARIEQASDVAKLVDSLRRQGVSDAVLETAVAESRVEYKG